ncbi:MAG TPA: ABC transporter permease [Zeimonas sp.]|nr:ABC transporter permease [Zeimonas sp.]
MNGATNVLHLGIKELRSLLRDRILLTLVVYAFTLNLYVIGHSVIETLNNAPIAIVDEDRSPLSGRIADSFLPPHFMRPAAIGLADVDPGLDSARFTFALIVPPGFERDLLAGRGPTIQLNVDATQMTQAWLGAAYIQAIVTTEVMEHLSRYGQSASAAPPVELAARMRFNPALTESWFMVMNELIGNVTMLSIILTGAALIRERERGTIEHLLAMPLTPLQIMAAKVWSMALVVLVCSGFALTVVIGSVLGVPVAGSVPLFVAGTALHLFATTSMGIFMGTVARSMPQLGLLVILVLLPLELLSGGMTPRESMPELVRTVMLAAPTTHFTSLGQAILFRGAGLDVVWPQFAAIAAIGATFFVATLARFRRVEFSGQA